MAKLIIVGVVIVYNIIYNNAWAQNVVQEVLRRQPVQRPFTVNGQSFTLKEIIINNGASNWNGLKLCWLKIPRESASMQIREVNAFISTTEFKALASGNDIVMLNGGFFDFNKKPDGLLRVGGVEKSSYKDWNQGGILIQDKRGSHILPIDAYKLINFKRINYALQSKPIVVQDSNNAIKSTSTSIANRIGIGFTKTGDYIVCIGFNSSFEALSMFEFGELLSTPESKGGLGADIFLAFDGGPSTTLYIPSIKYYVGTGTNHIANTVHLIAR